MTTKSFTKCSFSILAVLILMILPVTAVLAAASGPNNAGTGSNVTGTGTIDWQTPGNISADDTSYATADLTGTNVVTSRYLEGTNYAFAIPAAASIDGIQVTIGRFESATGPGNDVRDTVVRLMKAGNITGDNKADTGTDWSTATSASATYGSSSDLWGVSWTPADINASNFGVALAADSDNNRLASVDYMQITVSYTVNTTTSVNCGAGTPMVQYDSSISCVATVTRAFGSDTPSGSVTWGTTDGGSFGTSTCTNPTAATLECTAVYTPSAVGDGSHKVTATYAGDLNFNGSSGNQDVTVTSIALVPSFTANNKVYDGTNAATIASRSVTGVVGSDNVHLTGGTATFDEKNVGNVKTVTGSGFSLSGAQAGNYHLSPTTATTTANITPAGLSVSGVTANNKVYDGTTAATLSGSAGLSGTIFGADIVTLGGTPSASFADKNVGSGKSVNVVGYTLSGPEANDYSLSQPSGLTANITAKDLIITADNKSKVVGNPDPVFTFTPSGLVGSDSFVTAPTCNVPAAHTLPGTYDIVCSGGDAGANYTISNYVNGTLTVNAVNNAPTDIALSPSNVDENRPVGTVVGALSTSDPDAGDTFTYSFCNGADNTSFQFSGSNLLTAAIFDFETKSSYSICVKTMDSGNSSFDKQFTVTVNNKIDTATFADVPTSYWSWAYIESIYAAGITGGCGVNPLIYCPTNPVTRAQMAVFLLRGIHGGSYAPPTATGTRFADVSATYWAAAWIEQLATEGVTAGCGGGNYCPDSPVTRAQMAIFLLKSKHGISYSPPSVGSSTGFSDVPTSYWAAAWIKQLAAEAITGGCGSGNYCPDSAVTRDQMAVFLQRTFGLPMP
jgi:YDG domain/MBG domain (YGX type)/Bacterial Ig-like domain (group 3)/S-layer homology domain